jgi:hypothetical protein
MFRFTIRDLLWLTVVVAILTTWWIEQRQTSFEHAKVQAVAAEKQAAAAEKIAKLQKEVTLQNQVARAQQSIIKARDAEIRDSLKRREEVANALRIIRGEQGPSETPQK